MRSAKNIDFWKQFQNGLNPVMPDSKKTFSRFLDILKQAGVNVKKEGNRITAMPLTDKDVLALSSGEIKDGLRVNAKTLLPEPGGLFDPVLTGGLKGDRWTHVKLVEPVVNPIFSDAAKSLLKFDSRQMDEMAINQGGQAVRDALNNIDIDREIKEEQDALYSGKLAGANMDKAVKRLKYLSALKDLNMKPGDAYTLSVVPVTPPAVRPLVVGATGDTMDNDANSLYRDLILQNNSFKKIREIGLSDAEIRDNRRALNKRMSELTGLTVPESRLLQNRGVKGAIAFIAGDVPKEGYFQRKVIYGKMNLSGRATISPDTTLGLDEVGMPEQMAWEMYKPFVIRKLVQAGYSPLKAQEAVTEKAPAAKSMLQEEMEKRPVILNRAPTLWCFGMLAAKPLLRDGKNLRINAIWETGLNADYDGDAMQVHLPVTDEAVEEAKTFFPSVQLFTDKKKNDLGMVPKGEPVMGLYKVTEGLGEKTTGKVHKFKKLSPQIK